MSKKIKIQITHWITGAVLFEYEAVDNTIAKTLEVAVKRSANLRSANLRSANLGYANLDYANLGYANLGYANLRSADLRSANLRSANLRSANLGYAKNLNSDATDFWWHVHHEILVEQLTKSVRARINYIKGNKPKGEIDLRLKLLRPVLGKIPSTDKGWEALHKKECPKCPWNGKTIFPPKSTRGKS